MKPANEKIALSIAATLLKQVRRVLRHATDAQASTIKQTLERSIFPALPSDIDAPEPDDVAFFQPLLNTFGEDFAKEALEGDAPPPAEPTANESALQQQIATLTRQQTELQSQITQLLATKPQQ